MSSSPILGQISFVADGALHLFDFQTDQVTFDALQQAVHETDTLDTDVCDVQCYKPDWLGGSANAVIEDLGHVFDEDCDVAALSALANNVGPTPSAEEPAGVILLNGVWGNVGQDDNAYTCGVRFAEHKRPEAETFMQAMLQNLLAYADNAMYDISIGPAPNLDNVPGLEQVLPQALEYLKEVTGLDWHEVAAVMDHLVLTTATQNALTCESKSFRM